MTWGQILALALTGQIPAIGFIGRWFLNERKARMKLIVDLEKDLEFLKDKFARLIPEGVEDVKILVKKLATDAQTSGVTTADVATGLKQAAEDFEQQARAQGLPV